MGRDVVAEVGARIAALRQAAGLSQARLADASGMSPEFVSRLERGLKSASLLSLARIAEALGVEVQEFFRFESGPPSRKRALARRVAKLVEDASATEALKVAQVVEVLIGRGKKK